MNIEIAQLAARNEHLEFENAKLRKGIPALSKREAEVYKLMAHGMPVSKIGAKLFLSAKTISTYRARLLEKFDLQCNADLVLHAIRNRVIEVELLPLDQCVVI